MMIEEYDEAYYLRREASARRLARSARDMFIEQLHSEMADSYAQRAAEAAGRQRQSPASPV